MRHPGRVVRFYRLKASLAARFSLEARAKIPVELNPVAPPVHSEARPRAAKGTEMAPEDYSRSSIYSLATGQGSGASPRVDNPPGPRFPGPNFARLLIDNANPPSPDNSPLIPPARPRR